MKMSIGDGGEGFEPSESQIPELHFHTRRNCRGSGIWVPPASTKPRVLGSRVYTHTRAEKLGYRVSGAGRVQSPGCVFRCCTLHSTLLQNVKPHTPLTILLTDTFFRL